jgi:caffeoyl-CoA O-methyltransferase
MDAADVFPGAEVDNGEVKPVTSELLQNIDDYVERLFLPPDAALQRNLAAAKAAGLPTINVSATEGKLLQLLVKMVGARRILEIGTLGGYSTTWLARALPQGGTVVSLEVNPKHAAVARENVSGVAPGVTIDIRVGDAKTSLESMIAAHEPPFDAVFIDADKMGYIAYLELSLQLVHSGSVILADNLIRHGLVLDETTEDVNARGAQIFNRAIAAHPRLESLVLPIIRDKVDGLSISIVK